MSTTTSPTVAQAITFAQHAAHCHRTGQPNLAALYEKNCILQMRKALAQTRAARIEANPFRAFVYLGEDLGSTVTAIAEAVTNIANEVARVFIRAQELEEASLRSDFALVV